MSNGINKRWIYVLILFVLAILLLRRGSVSTDDRVYAGAPLVLILATHTTNHGEKKAAPYLHKVIENRKSYAQQHGYQFVIKNLQQYSDKDGHPLADGWARLFAIREVQEEYPDSEWFWYLDQDAIIMDTQVSLTKHILSSDKLGGLVLRDVPIGAPGSLIRTLKAASVDSAQLILSHDHSGLNTKSFVLKNGDFMRYLLDAWTEPVSRIFPILVQ